jgi:hypothetical protein
LPNEANCQYGSHSFPKPAAPNEANRHFGSQGFLVPVENRAWDYWITTRTEDEAADREPLGWRRPSEPKVPARWFDGSGDFDWEPA